MKIHVKIQDKIYEVKVGDILTRPIQAVVDGEMFEVWPEEMMTPSAVQRIAAIPPAAQAIQPSEKNKVEEKTSQNDNGIKAPIPGVIIDVKVSAGDSVVYGQELCVLEAMKMKNSIRSGKAGTIDKVLVSTGDQVSQGQLLMEYRREA
jgi:glutaconyl-CoA/methylmalonyl-CoA decarboxylase subunit gamma